MKKSVVALLHIGFWLCYLVLIVIVIGAHYAGVKKGASLDASIINAFKNLFFFALLPSFFTFYLYCFLLFPYFLQKKKYTLTIVFGVMVSALVSFVCYLLLRFSIGVGACKDMDKDQTSTPFEVIIFMMFIDTIAGVVGLVMKGFIAWFDDLKFKEDLTKKNYETEMALIKAQLDPHFLFNTLNNIDVLILRDAQMASDYLNKLSEILRFMLYETKTDKIILSKEITYIEKYIELQKIRTDNKDYVSFEVSGDVSNKNIAPMIFIPFIENAFKHTNNKKTLNAIKIRFAITDRKIDFVCENKFNNTGSNNTVGSGLGNELIKKRIQLLYPNKHNLEVTNENELYRVHLTIKNG